MIEAGLDGLHLDSGRAFDPRILSPMQGWLLLDGTAFMHQGQVHHFGSLANLHGLSLSEITTIIQQRHAQAGFYNAQQGLVLAYDEKGQAWLSQADDARIDKLKQSGFVQDADLPVPFCDGQKSQQPEIAALLKIVEVNSAPARVNPLKFVGALLQLQPLPLTPQLVIDGVNYNSSQGQGRIADKGIDSVVGRADAMTAKAYHVDAGFLTLIGAEGELILSVANKANVQILQQAGYQQRADLPALHTPFAHNGAVPVNRGGVHTEDAELVRQFRQIQLQAEALAPRPAAMSSPVSAPVSGPASP